jgi:carbon starvation protein CstA
MSETPKPETSKPELLEKVVQILSSEVATRTLRDADKKLKAYVTDIVQRTAKKLMTMIAGGIMALIGALFLLVAFSEYINETMNSTWIGWGIGGLVAMVIGLLTYVVSRR